MSTPSPVRLALAAASFAAGAVAQDPGPQPVAPQVAPQPVDLSAPDYASLDDARRSLNAGSAAQDRVPPPPPLMPPARQWFERFDLWGYVSGAYLHTSSGGSRPGGALLVDQASLFLQAEVKEDVTAFLELQTDGFPQSNSSVRTGEVHVHVRRLAQLGDDGELGLKVGRFDLPFGEYYLLQDAPDNPLVSYPVALPYGWDEGVLVYGSWAGLRFVGALTEGNFDRTSQRGLAPSVTLRVGGDPCRGLSLSASWFRGGETAVSSFCFSGAALTPVGGDAASTLGSSPKMLARAQLGEVDVLWRPHAALQLRAAVGHGRIDDADPAFDRDITWFVVEPAWWPRPNVAIVGRWSEAGTYDDDEGYRFEGKPFGNGTASAGYDLQRLRRLSLGVSWKPSPAIVLKVEAGCDHLHTIAASAIPDDDRTFVGVQAVFSF